LQDDISEYLALPDGPRPTPPPSTLETLARPLTAWKDIGTWGPELAKRAGAAFAESFPSPESVYERHPWTRYFKPAAAATHLGETVMAVPGAIMRAGAELGPDKAKALTEALIGIGLGAPGPRSLLSSMSPAYARAVAARQV